MLIEDSRGGVVTVPLHSGSVKRMRVRMLRSVDQLCKGLTYNLPQDKAQTLIALNHAVDDNQPFPTKEEKPTGPSETKPAGPSETKTDAKPKRKKKA